VLLPTIIKLKYITFNRYLSVWIKLKKNRSCGLFYSKVNYRIHLLEPNILCVFLLPYFKLQVYINSSLLNDPFILFNYIYSFSLGIGL